MKYLLTALLIAVAGMYGFRVLDQYQTEQEADTKKALEALAETFYRRGVTAGQMRIVMNCDAFRYFSVGGQPYSCARMFEL